jgi:hypothetical protein
MSMVDRHARLHERARVEFWWLLERWSGRLWLRLCPDDRASYWLDWLPAFTYRQRRAAEVAVLRRIGFLAH